MPITIAHYTTLKTAISLIAMIKELLTINVIKNS